MPTFIAGLVALYLVLAAIKWFGRLTPAAAARIARTGGGALSVLSVLLFALRGRFSLASLLASLALGAATRNGANPFGSAFRAAGVGGGAGRSSTVRSAMIEMRLDHDSGALSGSVLAGRFQGRALDMLTRPECLELYATCRADDPEGARLLETYLDRRFTGWRDADQRQGEARGRARGDSAMSRDEAHEILGLAKGASAEEIIRAHRSLMKKLHPDHGGSTALAARVNQAKDVLLNRHG
jgi:DnaJ domain